MMLCLQAKTRWAWDIPVGYYMTTTYQFVVSVQTDRVSSFIYLFHVKINDRRTRRPLILSDTEKYNIYTAKRNTKNAKRLKNTK